MTHDYRYWGASWEARQAIDQAGWDARVARNRARRAQAEADKAKREAELAKSAAHNSGLVEALREIAALEFTGRSPYPMAEMEGLFEEAKDIARAALTVLEQA
jgi:hypothetical protein